jgi:hypothetical protein
MTSSATILSVPAAKAFGSLAVVEYSTATSVKSLDVNILVSELDELSGRAKDSFYLAKVLLTLLVIFSN